METTYLVFFFIIGTFMGSFYTVVGNRLPKNISFIKGRSHCDVCNHTLSFIDMIPILSYIGLKGKCRYCNSRISPQSTYMEIYTGELYALSYCIFGTSYKLLIAIGIITMLIIISISDTNYLIIPDEIIIFFSFFFIIINLLNIGITETFKSFLYGIILFLLMYIIMLIGNKIFKKESLGGGDIKLMFIFGLIETPLMGIVSIFIGSIIALPISLYLLYKNNEHIIPFGPFLLLGLTLVYMTQFNDNALFSFLNFYT